MSPEAPISRDPRVDPQQYDRLKLGASLLYRVLKVEGEAIFYEVSTSGAYTESDCSHKDWRRHMRDAEVLP